MMLLSNIQIYNIENMSAIKIDLIHAFGSTCSQKYRGAVSICDEEKNEAKVIFPVGKALAKKSIDRPEMEFVHFHEQTDYIENITVLPTRAHVAVSYSPYGSQLQTVKIYSFSSAQEPISIKIFPESEKSGSIKQLAFAPSQPKFMCALLGEPHSKLLFVDTFKNKSLAQSGFTLRDVDTLTICPSNSHLICVSGGSSIRLLRVEQYTFKPLQDIRRIPKGRRITTHAWYKKKMIIAATDKCEVLVLEQARQNCFEIRQEYHNVFNQAKFDRLTVAAICTFSKGFILGSNNGKFCLWTRKENNCNEGEEALQLSRKWATTDERAAQVTGIEISTRQDIIAVSLANNDIATLYINELIPQVSDLLNDLTDKQIVFEYIYKGFHNAAVTGFDICEQRPLVASCSQQDSTIRIWNYKSYGCKLLRMFYFKIREEFETDKPLLTLAFHPSGYYLAVGCVDKLRMFHVLNTELRPYRQIGVKNAHIVKFSRGGHLLATCFPVRQEASANHIKVFNALTLQEIILLKDHGSMIRSLQFKKYDQSLLSASQEGAIIEWRLSDWTRSKNIQKKEIKYHCCIYWHARNTIVAFGESYGKKYLEEHNCDNGSVSQHELDMEVVAIAELNVGKEKALVLSLKKGQLVVFGGLQRPIVMDMKNYHIDDATCLVTSPCGKYLITSGKDCLVLVFKILHEVDGQLQEEEHSNIIVDDFLADVVLINRREIEKVNEKEKEFNKVIANLAKKLKMFAEEGLQKHNKRMLEVELQKNRIIDDSKYRIERLRSQVEQLSNKNTLSLQTLDHNHLDRAESLEKAYEEKISFEIEKYFQLEQELIQIKLLHRKTIEELKRLEEEEINKLKQEFELKFRESEKIYSFSKKESQRAINVFEERLHQIEEEEEDEIREIQNKKHRFKLETAGALQQLCERQNKLKKDHAKLQDQRDEEQAKNQQKCAGKKKLEKELEQAREKLKDMTTECNQKLDILNVKQQRISEFEQKIADLQKKKHILSYKGTEMKKAMEPKELQIEKLKSDLIKLKKQFELSLRRKQKSISNLENIENKKVNLEKLLSNEQTETQKIIETIDQVLSDVYHCIETHRKNGDVRIFYQEYIKLYHRYVNCSEKGQLVPETKGIDELTKQVLHLEKSLYQINHGNEKNISRKNEEIFKRTKQNTELVTNLNEIKKENKEILLRIKSRKDEIERLRVAKNALLSECNNVDDHTYKMFLQDDFNDIERNDKNRGSMMRSSATKLSLIAPSTKDMHEGKKQIQKIECELMSEIEFTNQHKHKVEFYIKDMTEKIRKHLAQFKCSPAIFFEKDEKNEALLDAQHN